MTAEEPEPERPASDPQFWIDTSADGTPSPTPAPTQAPAFNPCSTVCLTVVGAHLAALALAVTATTWLWPHLGAWRPLRVWPTFLVDSLMAGHIPLLTLWLWCGPRPLPLRGAMAIGAGAIVGATVGLALYQELDLVVPVSLGFFYLFFPTNLCFYLMVGLWLFAAELEIVQAAQARAPRPRTVVQFTIRTMIGWTLLASMMLVVGKWLAAAPDFAGAMFAILGSLWGVWTGLLTLREPFFPLPRWWQLLSLVVAACAVGAMAGMGWHSVLPGAVFVITAGSGVGTLYILRRFDYRLQITTMEKHLRKVRDIVRPEIEPTDGTWRELADQALVDPARDP